MQIVENLIQTHVDVLCLAPSGSKELVPVVGKANRAGIPVLIVDSKLDEATAKHDGVATATFIGSDNYEGGRIAGAALRRELDRVACDLVDVGGATRGRLSEVSWPPRLQPAVRSDPRMAASAVPISQGVAFVFITSSVL